MFGKLFAIPIDRWGKIWRRGLFMMSSLVIASILLSACGGPVAPTSAPATEPPAPAEKKVTTFIWTQEFDTLSPLYTNEWFSEITQQLWLCWAWNFDENNEPVPYLVKELPTLENGDISADGTMITLRLKDEVKWSDGTPITADDFLFTYQMYIDKNNAVASAYPYDQIQNMEAPDAKTVVITFEQPFAPWAATLWKGILPAHVLKPVYEKDGTLDNADWNLKPTVGCGPYLFDEWESGSFARFVINENHWLDRPKIDEIFIRFVPDDASQVAALKAGDGDLGTFIAYSDVPELKEAGVNIITVRSGYNEGWFMLMGGENAHPAMLDNRVRKAIVMAVDREAINRDLLLGLTGVPASYWDALPYFNTPPLENYPYDPEGAKKLLDEAGWIDTNNNGVRDKDGVEFEITYGTNIREIRQDTQAVVQQQLADVGIKVELLSFEDDVFFASYADNGPGATGQIDIMQWSDTSSFPDPDYYYWYCSEIPTDDYPAGSNWQFYCNEELDGLFSLQATQVDPKDRQATFQKINQIFYDEVVWVGLWRDPDIWAVGNRLMNVKFSGVTPLYKIAEWDLNPSP